MDELKGLNVSSDLLKHLEETKKSFPVEADLKAGSMLMPDREKLLGIMTKRYWGIKNYIGSSTDNILAVEKVYADGGGDPEVIDRVDKMIEQFNFIRRDPEGYKAKIEASDYRRDSGSGMPDDEGRKCTFKHWCWLASQTKPPGNGTEAAIISERHFYAEILTERHFDLQKKALMSDEEKARRLEEREKVKANGIDFDEIAKEMGL